jgi:hypothetical protein
MGMSGDSISGLLGGIELAPGTGLLAANGSELCVRRFFLRIRSPRF